jgi:adenylylsulfate kinase
MENGGLTVWFTGLSSAGKTSISRSVCERLRAAGHRAECLDGDEVRASLSRDLGFARPDRDENVRRIGSAADRLTRQGAIVLVSAVSPYRAARQSVREQIGLFLEVHVNAPLAICERRDSKDIYRRGRLGEIRNVAGLDDPYEAPTAPDEECRTDLDTLEASTEKVVREIEKWLSVNGT